MRRLRTAWIIARKDLRLYFRDRTGMALGFLLPIVLITVFGFLMQFAFRGEQGMPRVELWVADEDDSQQSRRLIETLRESDSLRLRPRSDEPAADAAKIRELVHDGAAHHGLIIERGFGQAVSAGRLPKLTMVRDPGRTLEDRVVQIALVQSFMAASEGRLWPAAMGKLMRDAGMDETNVENLIAAARAINRLVTNFIETEAAKDSSGASGPGQDEPRSDPTGPEAARANAAGPVTKPATKPAADRLPFKLEDLVETIIPVENEDIRPPGRPRTLTYMLAQSVAGTTVMMLMFGVLGCSTMLLSEREGGTLPRLLTAAIPRGGVYWGKFLFTFIIAMIQLGVLFAYGNLLFHIEAFRDPIALVALSITWAAAVTSFGMLVAAWARTSKQAEGLSTILILVMAAAGGCWFPIQMLNLPWFGEVATRCSLAYWAMEGYQGMFWQQWSLANPTMLTAIAVQWAFTIVGAIGGLLLYRRRYVPG
ncbi:MAG: hypothetical protein A2V70_21205 [Planctomycetes bacterium RBG_13_63_9]|nr:MAG: hypothetical protein A2V70_21205 [Planctomycetes bacterium RBG_13_63_9]